MNKSFTTFSGPVTSRSLLFPMEKVFESYVYRELKKVFTPAGWNCAEQVKGKWLFEQPHKKFSLRPDIVIRKGGRIIVLDTKWKNLINNEHQNYGISTEDMYQMFAYSKKFIAPEIWLLYPINNEMRGHSPIEFISNDDTRVRIHFVDIENIKESLEELRIKIEEGYTVE